MILAFGLIIKQKPRTPLKNGELLPHFNRLQRVLFIYLFIYNSLLSETEISPAKEHNNLLNLFLLFD